MSASLIPRRDNPPTAERSKREVELPRSHFAARWDRRVTAILSTLASPLTLGWPSRIGPATNADGTYNTGAKWVSAGAWRVPDGVTFYVDRWAGAVAPFCSVYQPVLYADGGPVTQDHFQLATSDQDAINVPMPCDLREPAPADGLPPFGGGTLLAIGFAASFVDGDFNGNGIGPIIRGAIILVGHLVRE